MLPKHPAGNCKPPNHACVCSGAVLASSTVLCFWQNTELQSSYNSSNTVIYYINRAEVYLCRHQVLWPTCEATVFHSEIPPNARQLGKTPPPSETHWGTSSHPGAPSGNYLVLDRGQTCPYANIFSFPPSSPLPFSTSFVEHV